MPSGLRFADKVGQDIQIGSYIVYGHALGRCAGLRLGKVLDINDKVGRGFYDYKLKKYEERAYSHFTVIGVDDDWESEEPKLLSKKSTLQFNDRIIVLKEDQIPKN